MEALDRALESGIRATRDREMGQHGLFGFAAEEEHRHYPLAKLPDWTMEQKLAGEKEVLGIYVSGHPLDPFQDKITELAKHFTDKL
jgi:DNA polymerase-3 subunit alpha